MPTTTAPPILGGISPDDIRRSEGGHLTLTGDEFTRLFRFIGASVRFSAPALASAGDLPDRALEATTGVQKLHEQVDQQWYRKAREKVWSKITYAVKTKLPGKLGKGLRRNDRGVPIWPTAWADWSGKTWKSEDDAYEDILKDLENAVSDNESDGGHSNEDAEEEAIHSGDEDRNMDIDVRPVSPIEQPTAPRAPSIHDVGTSLNDPANRVAHQRSGDESMHRVAPGKTGFGWLFNNGGESSQPKNPSATPQPSVEMRDMPKAIGDRRALGGFLDEYSPRDLSVTTGQAQQDERPKQNAEARLQSMPGSWASPSVGHGPDQGLSSTAPPQEQTSARLQPSYRPAYVEDDPAASAPPRDKQVNEIFSFPSNCTDIYKDRPWQCCSCLPALRHTRSRTQSLSSHGGRYNSTQIEAPALTPHRPSTPIRRVPPPPLPPHPPSPSPSPKTTASGSSRAMASCTA